MEPLLKKKSSRNYVVQPELVNSSRDESTCEDRKDSMEIAEQPYNLSRRTSHTRVARETTDDA